mmetsp:Transcript_22173/g.52413  ORF Transcript_22173/g.52413 Transcript_22173/m.52413 type:complete len:222 (-) Transcript_22173:1750-2415(-)
MASLGHRRASPALRSAGLLLVQQRRAAGASRAREAGANPEGRAIALDNGGRARGWRLDCVVLPQSRVARLRQAPAAAHRLFQQPRGCAGGRRGADDGAAQLLSEGADRHTHRGDLHRRRHARRHRDRVQAFPARELRARGHWARFGGAERCGASGCVRAGPAELSPACPTRSGCCNARHRPRTPPPRRSDRQDLDRSHAPGRRNREGVYAASGGTVPFDKA